jgi:hypothetical protein
MGSHWQEERGLTDASEDPAGGRLGRAQMAQGGYYSGTTTNGR